MSDTIVSYRDTSQSNQRWEALSFLQKQTCFKDSCRNTAFDVYSLVFLFKKLEAYFCKFSLSLDNLRGKDSTKINIYKKGNLKYYILFNSLSQM